jgi:copper homeostasis protein
MNNILLEVCCGSADDVIQAFLGGAERVELNSCLFHGGLTPSVGELIVAKKNVPIPVMTMIRPRQGGFCYTGAEYQTALADAEVLLKYGSDGLVFGFLNADGTLDEEKCRDLVALAGDKETVFHRAIDVTPDWRKALERLIHIGVTRVLTSGQAPDVFYGTDVIREMVAFAQGAIQILPGAGVNVKNIDRVIQETGCTQVHAARFSRRLDFSTRNNQEIFFGGALYPPEDGYDVTDRAYITQLHHHCKE